MNQSFFHPGYSQVNMREPPTLSRSSQEHRLPLLQPNRWWRWYLSRKSRPRILLPQLWLEVKEAKFQASVVKRFGTPFFHPGTRTDMAHWENLAPITLTLTYSWGWDSMLGKTSWEDQRLPPSPTVLLKQQCHSKGRPRSGVWLRDFPKDEGWTLRTEISEALPKGADFILNSVKKSKPKEPSQMQWRGLFVSFKLKKDGSFMRTTC